MTTTSTEQDISAVMKALEKPEFEWRTVNGIANDAGLEQEQVQKALVAVADRVVRSAQPTTDGQQLYTTRDRFRVAASIGEKILGAIKNRAM